MARTIPLRRKTPETATARFHVSAETRAQNQGKTRDSILNFRFPALPILSAVVHFALVVLAAVGSTWHFNLPAPLALGGAVLAAAGSVIYLGAVIEFRSFRRMNFLDNTRLRTGGLALIRGSAMVLLLTLVSWVFFSSARIGISGVRGTRGFFTPEVPTRHFLLSTKVPAQRARTRYPAVPATPAIEHYAGLRNAQWPAMPTILVAEDDAPVRALIHRILTREGFDVLCPPNPRIAVEVAAAHPGAIDLLVADISGTGDDDSGILEQLDALRVEPAVLYLSSERDPPVRAGSWITKPFRPAALVQKVKRLLRNAASKRGGEAHAW